MSLIAACAIFCCLKFRVVCTCTFFGDTICLQTNRKMIKIVTLIDLHIVLKWLLILLFSLDTICLLTNPKMIKISDSFTYCIDIWLLTLLILLFNTWELRSHAFEMTTHFYDPTFELFCYSLTQPFTHSKYCLPNPFLFGVTPFSWSTEECQLHVSQSQRFITI
jgi:hypothetical protein